MGLSFILHLFSFSSFPAYSTGYDSESSLLFPWKVFVNYYISYGKKKGSDCPNLLLFGVDETIFTENTASFDLNLTFEYTRIEVGTVRTHSINSFLIYSLLAFFDNVTVKPICVLLIVFSPPQTSRDLVCQSTYWYTGGILLSTNRTVNVGFYSIENRLKKQGHSGTKKDKFNWVSKTFLIGWVATPPFRKYTLRV